MLVYVPTEEALDLAMDLARGAPVCAVESASLRLHGWAEQLGAVDLTDPDAAPVDNEIADAVDRLHFYGNNGYGPGFDRNQASAVLRVLAQSLDGPVDADRIVGAVLARGVSARGAKRLRDLLAKAT